MAKKLKSLNPIIGTGYKTLSMIKDGEDGNIENFPDTLPKIPRLSYRRLGVSGLEIGWEFEDKIYYTYELYGSTTKGFEASEENLIFQGLASSYFYEAKPGEKWYFKARAKNTHGRYTEFSSELVTYTVKLDNLGEYVEGGSINGALIENATINNAHIKDLHADKITAGVLDADRIGANSITSEKIQANAITTDKLAANTISSNHIQSGTITSGHIQTGAITAGSGIIADGAIGSAQISSLDAGKIEAGTIDTSKVTIQGSNGHLRLKGNRMQVFQGTGNQAKERVSVGDVNGDGSVYGLRVRGADGQTILLDENGVKSEGITDGAITNDKISDDANIDGAKLNINSVVSKINEDGTETIQGTKIEVDGTTLNTKLSTITNKQTEDSERISQAQSQITANTNAIKLKVDEQTYTTDKKDMTSKLEKNTSEISTMKGQIALKVEQTDIENAKSEMEGVIDTKIDSAKAEIKVTTDAISQNVSNLTQTVSNKADGSTVTTLSNKVGSLETSVNGISGKVTSLEKTTTDLGESVEGVQGEVSTLKSDVASLEVTTSGISQKVSSVESTTSSLTQQVTTAQNTANSANTKADNAQSTANTAKNTADSAKSQANTNKNNISTLQSTVTTTNNKVASLETNLNSITSRVSATETTANTLTTKVDNMKIGGRNLIRKADVGQNNSTATFNESTKTWTIKASAGAGGTWGCGLALRNRNILVPYGKSYVLSFEIKVPRNCSWNIDVNNYALTGSSWTENDNDNVSKRSTSSKNLTANQWIKCWAKWENTNANNSNKVDLYDNSNFGVVMQNETSDMTYEIRNIQGELGNIPTEYTPAPEDVDSAITAVDNKVNSANTNISNLTTRVSTAESKLTKDSLTTTIGNHYTTSTDVNGIVDKKGYATTSQVQQTVDGLQVKVQQSGGYNLLKNSGFKNGLFSWGTQSHNSPTGGEIKVIDNNGEWRFPSTEVKTCQIRLSNQTGKEYGISQSFKTVVGKKYTISFYYAGHRVPNANMIIRGTTSSTSSWLTSKAFNPMSYSATNGALSNWGYFTHTFTAQLDTQTLNIVINTANDNGYMWITQPQIEEGELANPYSPNPNEVYDGITTIDKNGVTVTASNVKSKTNMSADGFKITKTDTNEDVFKVNSDGTLYLKGQIIVTGGSVPTSNLSGTISSNQLNSSITSDINNAKNNASSALSTANTANNTANTNKNNITNLQGEVSTVKNNVASLEVTTSGISQKVSSVESTTATLSGKVNTAQSTADSAKTTATNAQNSASSANSKIDRLQVGGRNLAQSTSNNYSNAYSSFSGVTNTCPYLAKVLTDGLSVGDIITVRLVYKYTNIVATSGQTASAWIQGSGNVTEWNSGSFGGSSRKTLSGSGEHTFLYSFTITENHLKNTYWSTNIRHDYVQSGSVQWKLYKVEKGNKATDWTPAPEDVSQDATNKSNQALSDAKNYTNTQITTVNNKVASIQTDLSGITSRVTNTENRINTINGNVTSLTNRVTTAESKITESAITNTVKKNFYTKTETDSQITSKGYQTASQVQQTVNGLEVKVTQSGGYNLLRNTGFRTGDLKGWSIHQYNNPVGSYGFLTHTADWGFPDSTVKTVQLRMTNQTGVEYGLAQKFDTAIGKKYTISFYYASHRCSKANIIIRNTNGTWLGNKNFNPSSYGGGKTSVTNWGKISYTFTAKESNHTLNIVLNDAQNDGYMWIVKPVIEEGTLATEYSPHPSEIYDGITTIDKDGITVSNSSSSTHTQIDSSSFRVENNTGGTVAEFSQNSQIPNLTAGIINANEIYSPNICTKSPMSGSIKYIVNGSTGNDNNNGTTYSTPFKTVAKAVSMLNTQQDRSVDIEIYGSVAGFDVKGINGTGAIRFYFSDDAIVNGAVIIGGITNTIGFHGGSSDKPTFKNGISIYRCRDVEISSLTFRGTNSNGNNIYLEDVTFTRIISCDLGGLSTQLLCAVQARRSNLWIYNCRGSKITDVVAQSEFSIAYAPRAGTSNVPDYSNAFLCNYDGAGRIHNWAGGNFVKTPAKGWNPAYTPTQKTQTWSFNKIWSDETLNGWSDRQELIQGYASTWNTGRWTGYMQFTDGMAAIRNTISGGTNFSGRLYVQRRTSSGNSTGSKLCLYASDGTLITNSTTINRGQGVWVTLSSAIISKIASGAITYFYLKADSNNSATYFKCESNAKIEITYTK